MDYVFLTPNDYVGLRRERITQLEAEHYRLTLLIDEASNALEEQQIATRREEIERRLTVHREALATELESADPPDTEESAAPAADSP